MSIATIAVIGIVALVASTAACALAGAILRMRYLLDVPNARSSHRHPVPRGAGLGFVAVIVLIWAGLWLHGDSNITLAVLGGAVAVAAISFVDDLQGVSLQFRLLVQAIAIGSAMATLPIDHAIISSQLPVFLDRIVVGVAWLWFVNLFNFMDGIDGIASSQAVLVAVGITLYAIINTTVSLPATEAVTVGSAAGAFLIFNWPPARLFMGDVGSTALGFLLGWLLILSADRIGLAPALLPPMYFILDATTTLVLRGLRGLPLVEAHRDHAYQHAVDAGMTHRAVTTASLLIGSLLVGVGLLALSAPLPAFAIGLALTAGFTLWLRRHRKQLQGRPK